jgi:hypothetical protein
MLSEWHIGRENIAVAGGAAVRLRPAAPTDPRTPRADLKRLLRKQPPNEFM